MTKDQQINRQMRQCHCLSKICSQRSAQQFRGWIHLGNANAECPLEVSNGARKLTKKMRGPAHKLVGTVLPNSMVLLPGKLQQILGDTKRGGVLLPCHVVLALHVEYVP